jgi:hypothetical protein
MRIGSTRTARPERGSVSTNTPQTVAGPLGRLVAALRDAHGEAAQRLLLLHADHAVVVGAGARVGLEGRAAGQDLGVGGGNVVWVPTTRLARPSQKWPMAIFSLVISAWMSTMAASQASPSGQASSSRSTAEKGSSRLSM